ncbi:AsmA-like C-terminal region-containing protein, partial [Candidatus Pelagibacter sp.]|nr:AsmA-like C-terminal region-containing protein [Candidatus Pelagibacter sp.]
ELIGSFSDQKKLKYTVNSIDNQKISTLFSDEAEPLLKRYKFIKGFNEGKLDYHSVKKDGSTLSQIKIYDFKLKEVPVLTKILSLASLQGIADLVSGEGIRFNEFEMNFENKKSLISINEIYAIGPAISILMEGYVEKNKLVSLRGTLVPATTINKVIGSIPVLGKILVGSKTGEGVFGVSFKIKGPPKSLETTVNPIKTLTPRFITRTLEKIKKN